MKKNNKKIVLKRAEKYYSLKSTEFKIDKLVEVSKKYQLFRNRIYRKYGGLEFLLYLNYPRKLRDELVLEGNLQKYGLQDRQWKMALAEASGALASLWSNAIRGTRTKINQDKKANKFNEFESHYMFYILTSPAFTYSICKNNYIEISKDFGGPIDHKKCNRYLHRCLRKYRGNTPKSKSKIFTIDSNMYDIHKDKTGKFWLGIMSLVPRKRINIPLTSEILTTKNLTISIKGKRVEITEAKEVICKPVFKELKIEDKNILSVDKGYTELLCDNNKINYGEGLGFLLSKISDEKSEINIKRNKLRDLSKNYIKSRDSIKIKKAKNINKYNLGRKKFYRIKDYHRNLVKDFVNLSLNDFFKSNPNLKLLVTENLNFSYTSKKYNRVQKRRLNSWIKGILKNRLLFKCQQNGVLLESVNAAYTSQICPQCGYLHKDNRQGGIFHCLYCGFEDSADYVSSLNILSRFSDPDIDLFTSYKEVNKILIKRFNDRLSLPNLDSRYRCSSLALSGEARTTKSLGERIS